MGNKMCTLQPECKMCGLINTKFVHQALFPMYVIKVSDFLEMTGKPEPHGLLRQKGLLHEWKPGMFVIFVSHQWLGYDHPDEEAQHACVLRSTLRGMIDGSLNVEADIVTQSYGKRVLFSSETREQVREGYLFLDWFAIPQITARVEGINEEVTKSEAALAVQSIPAYVEVSNLFVALVPEAIHKERQTHCNYTTWLSRGWCRAELWCHLLSNKPDTSIILVHSIKEVKFMFPLDWLMNQIADGEFTVESDRSVVVALGELAVENKLQYLCANGPLHLYRFFLANKSRMLSRKSVNWLPKPFLDQFGFESLAQAAMDKSPMSGLLCAVFSGDCNMIRQLVACRAAVNENIHGLSDLGYYDTQTPIMVAAKSHQDPSLLQCLLDVGANVAHVTGSVPMLIRQPGHVKVLLEAKADLNANAPTAGLTPLSGVAPMATPETVSAMLAAKSDVNPKKLLGIGMAPLQCSVLFSRGNQRAAEIVRMLVEHRADLNRTARPSGVYGMICKASRVYAMTLGLEDAPLAVQHFATLPGSTALSAAAMIGDEALAKVLLEAGAEIVANDMGLYPEDMARMKGHCHLKPLLNTFHV